ncbi:hypothetical protein D3C78_1479180 [compost metagenome]
MHKHPFFCPYRSLNHVPGNGETIHGNPPFGKKLHQPAVKFRSQCPASVHDAEFLLDPHQA